ncbi:DNA alkylation response protein [Pseudonocardiaceae bacterium YIM PH 21723]|nr:DNA alkylation response protein [Pseudonocardiaceae bacterium YIM PH 21723]
MPPTHEVLNQATPLVDYDVAASPVLIESLHREGGGWAEDELHELGRIAGSAQAQEWGRVVENVPPVLHTHDRYGHRIDEVEFHPYWHELMTVSTRFGMTGGPWRDPKPGAHVARSAKFIAWGPVDAGHMCPIVMTYAAIPALRKSPELAAIYEPGLIAPEYEFGLRNPVEKRGLIAGMSMTEKQGGSDVRANTTTATPNSDGTYTIVGHKWFTSAPMSDVFLTLAQTQNGLSCFLLPRVLPDGTRNNLRLQRLKDKLGNRSNASSEIEYDNAVGWLVGEEGRGVPTIIEMVNLTRLDCAVSGAASARIGLNQAIHHAKHRKAFGDLLINQPLMRNVLADLAIDAEVNTMLSLRLARAVDESVAGDENEALFRRLANAVAKYWMCKRAPSHAFEALECLGGNGYVEESGMPRLYREAPLNSIWEGSGNVAALDSLRAMAKQPESLGVLFAELEAAEGRDRHYDEALRELRKEFSDLEDMQYRARRVVERIALLLQGSLVLQHGNPAVAEAFCVTRLGHDWGHAYGTLPRGLDIDTIINRATPEDV